MKKMILASLVIGAGALCSCSANADEGHAVINLPAAYTQPTLKVSHALVSNMVTARSEADMKVAEQTVDVKAGRADLTLDAAGPARYSIDLSDDSRADFYAAPGETITVDVTSLSPLRYTVSGTALMEGMTRLQAATQPIEEEFEAVSKSGSASPEQLKGIYDRYDKTVKEFLQGNLNSPAAAIAMLSVEGQAFVDAYEKLGPDAKASILMPFVEAQLPRARQQAEDEKFAASLAAGKVEAPDFTFMNLEGKPVKLSDFRGRWVVIDFWGSWCGWCIKGFPKLKEAYKAAAGKFEVIGVDCRDSEEAWRAAVAKYQLPWVNVYNPEKEGGVLSQYHVAGFPTKAIVNPDGKLVDITVGEDPGFYDKLSGFIGQ